MLFIGNFLQHFGDWLGRNRRQLVRALVIASGAVLLVVALCYGVERWQAWKYERRVNALEKLRHDADAKAKAAESRADALKVEMGVREAELRNFEAQAQTLDAALKTARGRTITLKEAYETIRYVDVPADVLVSVADACRDLAAVNYRCQ